MSTFDVASFAIGLILGLIIMLILCWISYFTRTGAFTYCAAQTRVCVADDYYNNPGEAISQEGVSPNDILYITDGRMYYKRVPKTSSCTPEGNQVVRIAYPQYCEFSNANVSGVTGRDRYFNANHYDLISDRPDGPITTNENCIPKPGQVYTNGTPILKWTAATTPQVNVR